MSVRLTVCSCRRFQFDSLFVVVGDVPVRLTVCSCRRCRFDSLFVVVGDVGKLLPALPVLGVGEAGVVGVQLGAVRQNLVGKLVQIGNLLRVPRHHASGCGRFVTGQIRLGQPVSEGTTAPHQQLWKTQVIDLLRVTRFYASS